MAAKEISSDFFGKLPPSVNAYEFVSNPENLPKWAAAFCKSVRKSNPDWIVDTSQDPIKVRFVKRNDLGVLVNLAPRIEIYVPMRALSNGPSSAVIFPLFRLPEMSDEKYDEDGIQVHLLYP